MSSSVGDFYNLEDDFVNKYMIDCNNICSVRNLIIFFDVKKIFKTVDVRKICDGILLSQKQNQSD